MSSSNVQIASVNQKKLTTRTVQSYVLTSNKKKMQLIDLVIKNSYSMKLASEIAGVKHSTVKYIIKKFRKDKKSFMKKISNKKRIYQKKESSQQKRIIQEQIGVQNLQNSIKENLGLVQSYNTENTNNGRITPEFYESPNYFFNFGNFQAGAPSFPTFYYIPYYQ